MTASASPSLHAGVWNRDIRDNLGRTERFLRFRSVT